MNKKYEYKFSGPLGFTDDEVIDSLNKLGKDGWEVVKSKDECSNNFLLKREVKKNE